MTALTHHDAGIPPASSPTIRGPWLADKPTDDLQKTLRQVFDDWCLPKYQHRWAKATITAHYTSLNHWEQLTSNPSLADFEADRHHDLLACFMRSMRDQDFSDSLIRKNVANLRMMLREVGPPYAKPGSRGVIDYVPYFGDIPPQVEGDKRYIAAADVGQFYRALPAAVYTGASNVPPPVFWRAMLTTFYTTGINWIDLRELTRHSLQLGDRCPDSRIPARSPHGWLFFVRTKTRRRATRRRPLCFPLTAVLRRHLDQLLNLLTGERLFALPTNRHPFDIEWKRLQLLAGLPSPAIIPQELRVTASSNWDEVRGGLGPVVLGQTARGVNERSYQRRLQSMAKRLDDFDEFYPAEMLNGPPA